MKINDSVLKNIFSLFFINSIVLDTPNYKFISVEPLIEDLGRIDLTDVRWVIVGGESGPKARPMREEWVTNIRDQCERENIEFFFKQWGMWGSDGIRRSKKANGRFLEGKVWDVIPTLAANA